MARKKKQSASIVGFTINTGQNAGTGKEDPESPATLLSGPFSGICPGIGLKNVQPPAVSSSEKLFICRLA